MGTPVFLLAAGLGTRLAPLTHLLPKPLLPVGDRPALAHVLARVRGLGGPIVANAHYRADDLRAFLDAKPEDGPVELSIEDELLGTAGGLAHAAGLLGPGVALVWNGDILADFEPSHLLATHAAGRAAGTLAVQRLSRGEGNVGTDAMGRIVRLRTETVASGEERGGLFLGIHAVSERLRARLPERGCLVGDVYLPALRRGETLRVHDVGMLVWHDIGTLDDYRAAHGAWLATRGLTSYVGPGARVAAGVVLTQSVVGAKARVEGEGAVVRSVVWPGAVAVAPLVDSVVTSPAGASQA